MNATDLLERQHRKVEAIFEKLEHTEREDAHDLVHELADNLAAHMTIEHELLYPGARKVDSDLVSESYEEHALAETAIKRLLIARKDDVFKARVSALKELIEHHVKEEEKELFPKLNKAMEDDHLEQLGEQMEERFEVVVKKGFSKLVPKGLSPTSADEAQKPRARSKAATKRKTATSRASSARRNGTRRRKAA